MTTAAPALAAPTFEFDAEFQQKIAALALRDTDFAQRTEGLIEPRFFDAEAHGLIARLANDYFTRYRRTPDRASLSVLLKDARDTKLIRKDVFGDVCEEVKAMLALDLSDKEFVIEKVSEFARHQAVAAAILKSVDLIDRRDWAAIEKAMKDALMVGEVQDNTKHSFFEHNEARAKYREDLLAGRIKPDGVTTGLKELDQLLYHRGWGRKELSVIMAPSKQGKSMSLISFAVNAALAACNVLYISLEVATRIVTDRMDANLAGVAMNDLPVNLGLVRDRVKAASAKAGRFDVYDFPTGTFRPSDLRRLLTRAKARGEEYDLVVVDYADIMKADVQMTESRDMSRQIYVDLRGIAGEFNAAVLSATQTNREGFKAAVGRMENVAEDINKARTVDLLISLNADEAEVAKGEARYYFAASRNQRGDMTVTVKTDIAKARAIERILRVE